MTEQIISECPFCLSQDTRVIGVTVRWVECNECGAHGPEGELKADAVDAWNTRPVTKDQENLRGE
jgi:Lar family restriction alleviation protein